MSEFLGRTNPVIVLFLTFCCFEFQALELPFGATQGTPISFGIVTATAA